MDLSKRLCIGAATLVTLALVPYPLRGQEEPECPSASQYTFPPGSLSSGGTPATLDIPTPVQPCETVKLLITVTSHPSSGASVGVTLRNADDVELFGTVFTAYGSGSGEVPSNSAWYASWFPAYPATKGIEGIPRKVRIQSNYGDVYSYSITVVREPRPGYNLGGTGFSNAPLIPLGTEIKGNVLTTSSQPGQFWKIHLDPGQRIWLTGYVTAPSTNFDIGLYGSDQQFIKYLVSMSPYVQTPFPAPFPEFVNGPQAADYYLRATTVWWPVWDFRFVVQTPPQLKLFLEADDELSFNTSDPSGDDDAATYVPCTLKSGESVPVATVSGPGQLVQLIAAYVNVAGQIVPPPSGGSAVTFSLNQTSSFTGYAMNAGIATDPDFVLVHPNPPGPDTILNAGPLVVDIDTTTNTASIWLRCRDYGGTTIARAEATAATTAEIHIPKDDGEGGGTAYNSVPDTGWKFFANGQQYNAPGASDLSAAQVDSDNAPLGDGTPGDGLTFFEEYRGFVVRGEHRRTNPAIKDLFIDSDVATYNIGDAVNLPLNKHWVFAGEIGNASVINFNVAVTQGHVAQKALIVRQMFLDVSGNGLFGNTPGCPCTPNGATTIEIYLGEIRSASPTDSSPFIENQPADGEMIRAVVGHEIGHGINMPHVFGGTPSLMWEGPAIMNTLNSNWTNVPHTYGPTELTLLRIH